MLRSIFFSLIILSFLVGGFVAPFVFSLGYVWVSVIRPQDIVYGFIAAVPASALFSLLAVLGYLVLDRKYPPRPSPVLILMILLPIWITITTVFFAKVPEAAWWKWDWAFKTVTFSAFMIFLLRSRNQIEAFLQVYVFSAGAHVIAAGGKTLLSGGGYGRQLGLMGGNSLWGEGATLAAIALMLVPLVVFLKDHNTLFPKLRIVTLGYLGIIAAAILGAVGTYQRTALVGLAVLAGAAWLKSQRKVLLALVIALAGAAIVYFASAQWWQRMDTIDTPATEASALGRLMVWRWTLDFALANPFGGGFEAYRINRILLPSPDPTKEPIVEVGKAFHSIYFEMLGEHGWPGLFILLALIGLSFLNMQRVIGRGRKHPGLVWAVDLAKQLQVSLLVLVTCGAFIGIAFQPMLYFTFAITECLHQHVRRCLDASRQARPAAGVAAAPEPPPALEGGWRGRRA